MRTFGFGLRGPATSGQWKLGAQSDAGKNPARSKYFIPCVLYAFAFQIPLDRAS
jgi:hypothetical protein